MPDTRWARRALRIFLRVRTAILIFSFCILLGGAQAGGEEPGEILRVFVVPEREISEQRVLYSNLIMYLDERLPQHVTVTILSSYEDIAPMLKDNSLEAAFLGSMLFAEMHNKYGIRPLARPLGKDGNSTYSGYIFTRADSGIRNAADMKGKKLALVSRNTTAGYVFPVLYLRKNGVTNMESHFSKIFFTGTHDIAAWMVYTGEADVGACKNHVFNELASEFSDFKKRVVVLEKSVEVPSNTLCVAKHVKPETAEAFKKALLEMGQDKKGREVLDKFGATKFIETTDEDFKGLYDMMKEAGIDPGAD